MELFDIRPFDEYKEDNRREVKRATGGLPHSLWETYSSFANCYGGVIILGVNEHKDGSWETTGLKDTGKLLRDFWNTVNNPKKTSVNLLTDADVETYDVNGDVILVIHVPMAKRSDKPVFINDNLFGGTYRRNWEGDYHCSREEVKAMLRDQTDETMDTKIIDILPLSDLNQDTIHAYRNYHEHTKEGHPFSKYSDDEYLRSIGAAGISKEDGMLHPTAAGLLMFGNDYDIMQEFPEYFLDYQEHLDPSIRWTDRLESTSGTWSGNVFDFFFRVYNKIAIDLKVPFKLEGIRRVDDTPVHKAVREALVNCLTNADFYIPRGVVIKKNPESLVIENPGSIRTGKYQMLRGGVSDCRNKALMKMFNLLDFGERAGSGVPNILQTWDAQGWKVPEIEEQYGPDRTRLTLALTDLGGQNVRQNVRQDVPQESMDTKIEYLIRTNPDITLKMIAEYLKVSERTIRRHIKDMDHINYVGSGYSGHWEINDEK